MREKTVVAPVHVRKELAPMKDADDSPVTPEIEAEDKIDLEKA